MCPRKSDWPPERRFSTCGATLDYLAFELSATDVGAASERKLCFPIGGTNAKEYEALPGRK